MKFDILAQINKRIPKHTKLCFLSGMIIGLVTHFYMLTNKFYNLSNNPASSPTNSLSIESGKPTTPAA